MLPRGERRTCRLLQGIGRSQQAHTLDRIDAVSGHGVSVTDPAFQALASSLGLSPQQLSNDLVAMKESLRASMPAPSQSPAPSSGQASEPASGAPSVKG